MEKIHFKTDKKDITVFLDDAEDKIWEDAVTIDFMKGYSEKEPLMINYDFGRNVTLFPDVTISV